MVFRGKPYTKTAYVLENCFLSVKAFNKLVMLRNAGTLRLQFHWANPAQAIIEACKAGDRDYVRYLLQHTFQDVRLGTNVVQAVIRRGFQDLTIDIFNRRENHFRNATAFKLIGEKFDVDTVRTLMNIAVEQMVPSNTVAQNVAVAVAPNPQPVANTTAANGVAGGAPPANAIVVPNAPAPPVVVANDLIATGRDSSGQGHLEAALGSAALHGRVDIVKMIWKNFSHAFAFVGLTTLRRKVHNVHWRCRRGEVTLRLLRFFWKVGTLIAGNVGM
ncbi:hypothetical protein BC829DRAFT_92116 [Chytridium lagenaria]|nr:hypothetical protein BC829DRAFT_92116 [Chytridium lagenaria]